MITTNTTIVVAGTQRVQFGEAEEVQVIKETNAINFDLHGSTATWVELCFGILTVLAVLFFIKKSLACCAKCLGLRNYEKLDLTCPIKKKIISIIRKSKSEPILSQTDSELSRASTLRKTLPVAVRFTLPDPDPVPEEPEEIKPAPLVGIHPHMRVDKLLIHPHIGVDK